MMSKSGKLWSNFWGGVGADGYYVRSPDYIDIVKYIRLGVWNVPFVSSIYLIKSSTIEQMVVNPFYSDDLHQDMVFCANNRKRVCTYFVSKSNYI